MTLDRVQQRYPYNNIVDVDYTISGMTGDPDDYRVVMSATAKTNGVTVTVAASNFTNRAWCDLVTSNGTWRASWDMAKDKADFLDASARVSVKLVYAPVAWSEATYLIVDLTSGSKSKYYPMRLVREVAPDPAMFNLSVYKETRLVMRRVKACTFPFGSSKTETTIANDYFVAVFPMTYRQYMLISGQSPTLPANDGDDLAIHRPAKMQYNWIWSNIIEPLQNRAYVRSQNGFTFKVPSREQWECACRAGTTTAYYWGSSDTGYLNYGWFGKNSNARPHAVGGKLPNAWGLYDMMGNTSEWTNYTSDGTYYKKRGAHYNETNTGNMCVYSEAQYVTYAADDTYGFRLFMQMK